MGNAAITEFIELKLDDDECEFSGTELAALVKTTGLALQVIRAELESFGLKLKVERKRADTGRGFSSNSHNRWDQNPTFSESGAASIFGMAGNVYH